MFFQQKFWSVSPWFFNILGPSNIKNSHLQLDEHHKWFSHFRMKGAWKVSITRIFSLAPTGPVSFGSRWCLNQPIWNPYDPGSPYVRGWGFWVWKITETKRRVFGFHETILRRSLGKNISQIGWFPQVGVKIKQPPPSFSCKSEGQKIHQSHPPSSYKILDLRHLRFTTAGCTIQYVSSWWFQPKQCNLWGNPSKSPYIPTNRVN